MALRRELPAALRRYKVDKVKALALGWLAAETDGDVKRRLFDTLHHMYIDAGRPVDEAFVPLALQHLAEQPLVLTRQTLFHVLGPYVGSRPEVKAALQAQLLMELEERSGLYSLVAQYLPSASVFAALSQVPSLRGQFGGGLPPVARPAPAPAEVPIDDLPGPKGAHEEFRGAP